MYVKYQIKVPTGIEVPIGQISKPNTSTMINRNTGAKPKIIIMAVFVWSEKMSRYVLSVERIRAFA